MKSYFNLAKIWIIFYSRPPRYLDKTLNLMRAGESSLDIPISQVKGSINYYHLSKFETLTRCSNLPIGQSNALVSTSHSYISISVTTL